MAELSCPDRSHDRIVSKLALSDRGEINLAQNTKLDRKAALKIPPGELTANRERMERLIRRSEAEHQSHGST